MIADDSMHFIGVPMDTLGTEVRYRYNRRHAFPPRVDRIGYGIGYWPDDFFKSMNEEENKNDNDINNDSENEGGTN